VVTDGPGDTAKYAHRNGDFIIPQSIRNLRTGNPLAYDFMTAYKYGKLFTPFGTINATHNDVLKD
jgi:hypothetical protein